MTRLKVLKTLITKEELAALPLRSYEGPIRLPLTPDEFLRARDELRQEGVVGVDTETRPSFRVGEFYPPALVQIASLRAVYLFRFNCRSSLRDELLAEVFENPNIVKAGIQLANDLGSLKALFPFREKNTLDLGVVAKKNGLGQTGMRNLAGMLLGFRISKGQKITNWSQRDLTRPQIIYAATDAWACLELYRRFQEEGFL